MTAVSIMINTKKTNQDGGLNILMFPLTIRVCNRSVFIGSLIFLTIILVIIYIFHSLFAKKLSKCLRHMSTIITKRMHTFLTRTLTQLLSAYLFLFLNLEAFYDTRVCEKKNFFK